MRKLPPEKVARPSLEEVNQRQRHPIHVVLNNIRSLYNVGAIFRISDGALIQKLYLCGITGYPPRRQIEKTALGATESVPWEYHKDALEVVSRLKEGGVRVVALERTEESIPYTAVPASFFPLCLIVGNEETGVDQPLLDLCELAIAIPQYGLKQSLNVAVAYGIAIYELVRLYRRSHGLDREEAEPPGG